MRCMQPMYARRQLAFISEVTSREICAQEGFVRAALGKVLYLAADSILVAVELSLAISDISVSSALENAAR